MQASFFLTRRLNRIYSVFLIPFVLIPGAAVHAESVYEQMHRFFSTPQYDESYHFFEITLQGVERGDRELVWSNRLAEVLEGNEEVRVERGRVDVLVEDYAIEVDRFEKYHEAIGQAIHYRAETGRIGVIALMVTRESLDLSKATYIEENLCLPNDLKMLILYAGGSEEVQLASAGSKAPEKSSKNQSLDTLPYKINLNTATIEELRILPGLGPSRAAAIVENRPYRTLNEVLQVRGIGEATLKKIQPFVVVSGSEEG